MYAFISIPILLNQWKGNLTKPSKLFLFDLICGRTCRWEHGFTLALEEGKQLNYSCAQPLLRGICLPFQSRGWGICKFCSGTVHLPTPGLFPSLWHARGFISECNYTEDITEKEREISSCLKDRRLYGFYICMHFFIAYQATITWRN